MRGPTLPLKPRRAQCPHMPAWQRGVRRRRQSRRRCRSCCLRLAVLPPCRPAPTPPALQPGGRTRRCKRPFAPASSSTPPARTRRRGIRRVRAPRRQAAGQGCRRGLSEMLGPCQRVPLSGTSPPCACPAVAHPPPRLQWWSSSRCSSTPRQRCSSTSRRWAGCPGPAVDLAALPMMPAMPARRRPRFGSWFIPADAL